MNKKILHGMYHNYKRRNKKLWSMEQTMTREATMICVAKFNIAWGTKK
jgi:hypothetical protein